MPPSQEASIDYDRLMQANLSRVFGERDAERRMDAITELYASDAVLYEPGASATGHTAINQAVGGCSCRAYRQTSPLLRLAPPLATTVSDGCAGRPVRRTVP